MFESLINARIAGLRDWLAGSALGNGLKPPKQQYMSALRVSCRGGLVLDRAPRRLYLLNSGG